MKIYLNVPYTEKDKAKDLGARFDMSCKRWYVPEGVDAHAFNRWRFGREQNFDQRRKAALAAYRQRKATESAS